MTTKIINLIALTCELGEGLYYSLRYNSLFWVDIKQRQLYCLHLQGKDVRMIVMPEQIGWVNETQSGRLIVGLQSGIYWLNDDLTCGELLLNMAAEPSYNRLNDAATDRRGCLYFGTMDDRETSASGNLYQLASVNNPSSLAKVDSGYVVSNGPAVNKAGNLLYSVNSAIRTIYAFTLNESGQLSGKRVFTTFPESLGYPDGIAVDARDNLWVACWQGHGLCCFNPQGQLIQRIFLPVPLVTNVTFAGPDYSRMFVTTARVGLSEAELKQYPLSGAVFEITSGSTGLPETPVKDH